MALQSHHCSFIPVNKTEENGLDNKQGRVGAGKAARLIEEVRNKTLEVLLGENNEMRFVVFGKENIPIKFKAKKKLWGKCQFIRYLPEQFI